MTKYKLDLFKVLLPTMDRHKLDAYRDFTAEEKKGFAGVVALRGLSNASEPYGDWYLIATNQIANDHFFDIADHPELQYKLLASCGMGSPVRHEWVGGAKKGSLSALRDYISRFWPHANTMEIDIILSKFTQESFSEFVDGSGVDTEEAKKLKDSFKNRK